MKFKGKKAIMAAALSAIVAANSFGTAITASAEQTYKIGMGVTGAPVGSRFYMVDSAGNYFSSGNGVPGNTYTYVIEVPSDCQRAIIKVWIEGDESSAVYPNLTGTNYRYSFVMPAHDIIVGAVFGTPGSLTPPTPTPTPTPDPTPTPTPDPTPTWKKGDADCNGTVNAADATAVLKHIVGIKMLSDQGFKNADMDDNGQITSADATAILKLIISKP